MRAAFTIILSALFLVTISHLQADELPQTEITPATTTTPDDWTVAKTDPTAYAAVSEVVPDTATTPESLIEIINDGSILTTRTFPPQDSGRLTFSAKHNKLGLLYIYAQTSDNGGQLLFSIQLTESRGILLEESDRQTTLLPNYTPNRWYEFVIDFDNTRGDRGLFTVTIDGSLYGEYAYVQSESELFDLAQITLGSESDGAMSVSAVTDTFTTTTDTASSSSVSDALLQLSISLSSTSISSNLDNGLLVTASLDGIASVATSSIATTTEISAEPDTSSSTDESEGLGLGGFLLDIVETVIDIFTPGETPTTTPVEIIHPEIASESEPLPTIETAPEPTSEENAVQSSISTDETSHADITTSTF